MLDLAVKHYVCLRNEKLVFHAHMEAMMTGEEIIERYDDGTLEFQTMGRSGGFNGTLLTATLPRAAGDDASTS
jgi:hypothetical protein